MLRIDKSQMRYLKADTGEELERAYNSLIDRLSRQAVRIEDRIISVDTFAAIILYSFKESIPQCLKDEYELEGVFPKCSDCPHFKDIGHGNGDCMKIEHVDTFTLRAARPII